MWTVVWILVTRHFQWKWLVFVKNMNFALRLSKSQSLMLFAYGYVAGIRLREINLQEANDHIRSVGLS